MSSPAESSGSTTQEIPTPAERLRHFAELRVPELYDASDYELFMNESGIVDTLTEALEGAGGQVGYGSPIARQGKHFQACMGETYQAIPLNAATIMGVGQPPMRFLGKTISIRCEQRSITGIFESKFYLDIPLFGQKLPKLAIGGLDHGAGKIVSDRFDSQRNPAEQRELVYASWLTQEAAAEIAELTSQARF